MTEHPYPIADEAAAAVDAQRAAQTAPGTAVALPTEAELVQMLGVHTIPVRQWAAALMEQDAYEEDDQEDAGLSIVRAILLASTSEEIFAAMNTLSVKELLGEDPGSRSQVFEIHSASPLKSTYEEGPSCFAVIRAYDLAEKRWVTMSCGARAVQAAILAHMIRGLLPMRAVFVKRRKPTRKGYYPVNLESGI